MAACLKTLPYLHRPVSPLKPFIHHRSPSTAHPLISPLRYAAAAMSEQSFSAATTVEHVVLFKVRDATDQSLVDSMVSNLRDLTSLGIATHLAVAPILRHRSAAAAAAGFTHLLHSRYRSKPDLASYSSDPRHVAVVKDFVFPICDDLMALDWEADLAAGSPPPPPGSAMRITLAKAKEGKTLDLLSSISGIAALPALGSAKGVSFGENFSPARAKGHDVGMLMVFEGLEELDALDGNAVEAQKEKLRPLLESAIAVDLVLPA